MRPTMLVDLQRCVGCMSCAVACKMENSVPVGIRLNTVTQVGPVGEWPYGLKQYYLPHACMQCNEPLCVAMCPTGASYIREEDGLVLVDPEQCIQCESCVKACPYGARSIDTTKNSAVKCTLCVNLIDKGELPSCVKHCIAEARFFGDAEDPQSDLNVYLAQDGNADRAIHLLENEGSSPTVTYLKPKCGMLENEVSDIDLI